MTDSSDLTPRLAALVARALGREVDGKLSDDEPLAAATDSIALLELVVAVEENFGVAIGGEDIEAGSLVTFGKLRALVAGRTKIG